MKKYLKIAVLVIAVMLLNITNVFAANATVELNADKTQVKVGDTVSVSIVVKGEHGIEALDSTLTYDKSKLELETDEDGDIKFYTDGSYSGMSEKINDAEFKLSFVTNKKTPKKEATLATLNFKVLSGAKVNDKLEIELSSMQVVQENETDSTNDEWVKADNAKLTLTVVDGSGSETGDNSGSGTGTEDNNGSGNGTGTGTGDNSGSGNGTGTGTGDNSGSGTGSDTNTGKGNTSTSGTDSTKADKTIVYAGAEHYIYVVIASVMLVGIISFVTYKKYKNI